MSSKMVILTKTKTLFKSLNPNSFRTISTFKFLSQDTQFAYSTPPLPPNPSSGSPLYQENWRNAIPNNPPLANPLASLGLINQAQIMRMEDMARTFDYTALMNKLADWTTCQRWGDMKLLFESWVRCLDITGKPNKPDVILYNHYLRANLMLGASAGELLDLVAQMEDYEMTPNTASYNLVLKAMHQGRETVAAEKLFQRMLQTGKEAMPDEESYDIIIGMLFSVNEIDAALKYLDLTLKCGYMLSMRVFNDCVHSCRIAGRLDTLASIIERCKKMDQNKALCPSWQLCTHIADVALQADNSKLAFYALEFLARWMARGEASKPPVILSADEGLVVAALGTSGRTYDPLLLDASWAILKRSLRQKRAPIPESYLGKIYAYASLGNLQKSFITLNEFESAYGSSSDEGEEDLFSPFSSLYPLVVACSKNGFETLDSVYFQLENLSRGDPPYKSVAAMNCIILGCANIWDLDRAYQTFEALSGTFGLTPNIHSYNALMCAFGKLKKTTEASNVFDHLVGLGVKPNATSYSLLVDAHLINRDQKAALSVIDEMVKVGIQPSKEILKKVRRRCIREMDYESDELVETLAKNFNIRMGTENRRDLLFNLSYRTDFP